MLKNVYALVGTDLFLQLDALAELLRAAPPDVQRIDLDGETAELADVLDELRSFAMFSSRKIVVVRDADEFVSRFRGSLEDYVAKPSSESTLVLRLESLPATQRIHKAIAAKGQIHNCNTP
jgi:DNA polymerase-3 subunit delta